MNFKNKTASNLFRIATYSLATIGLVGVVYFFTFYDNPKNLITEYKNEILRNHRVYAFPSPEKVSFAGEKIPIELFDVKEGIDREILVNAYWTAQTFTAIKRSARYFPEMEKILKRNGIPDDFKYLSVIESNLSNAVSGAGASGFWQFMKESGKENKLEINEEVDERYNLEKSTQAACDYLKKAYAKFGSWIMAAASYNMGKGALDRFQTLQNEETFFDIMVSEETTRYIYRAIATKLIFQDPQNYGFYFRKRDLYPVIPTMEVAVDTAISDLAAFAKSLNTNYKMIKYFNPWLRQRYLKNKDRKTYYIKIIKPQARNIKAYEAGLPMDTYLFEKRIDSIFVIHDSVKIIKRDTIFINKKKKGFFN